jgi:hypothetical protein
MKRFLILFVMVVGFEADAQLDTLLLNKNIYAAEDSMVALFKRRDWKSYANYMNPAIIKMTGGKEGFEQLLQQQMKIFNSADTIINKPGRILQLLKAKNQYQCIFESFMQLEMGGMTVSGSSYDIGISADGKAWTFFRITEKATKDQIIQILPDLNLTLKLPRSQMQSKTLEEFMNTYKLEYLE